MPISNECSGSRSSYDMTTGIIGAGLTGLTLGNLIEDCELLEKSNECGGLCRSLSEGGFTFDYSGSHIIFSRDKEVLNFLLGQLGTNVVRCRRNTKILYEGNYVKYPFENGLSELPLYDKLDCLTTFITASFIHRKSQSRAENFKEWLYTMFGRGIAERYLIPYNEKIWKYDIAEMSTSWVDGRVPRPPIWDVLKSALGITTEGYKHQLNFYYPKAGGINALIRAMERKCSSKILKGFDVRTISRENNKWVVSNGEERREYDTIIATQPLFSLFRALDHAHMHIPAHVHEAVRRLKYNSLITVMLGLDVEYLNDLSWLYIPDSDCLPHRVAFPSNYSKEVAPPGKSSLIAEITYNSGDAIDAMTDKELITRTIRDLHRRGIIEKDSVCFARVKRTNPAYVICDLDYERNMYQIRTFLNKAGIYTAGRFAEFQYLNMDACVRNAMDLATKFNDVN